MHKYRTCYNTSEMFVTTPENRAFVKQSAPKIAKHSKSKPKISSIHHNIIKELNIMIVILIIGMKISNKSKRK